MTGAIIASTALALWYVIFYFINKNEYAGHWQDVVWAFAVHSVFIWVAALWR